MLIAVKRQNNAASESLAACSIECIARTFYCSGRVPRTEVEIFLLQTDDNYIGRLKVKTLQLPVHISMYLTIYLIDTSFSHQVLQYLKTS